MGHRHKDANANTAIQPGKHDFIIDDMAQQQILPSFRKAFVPEMMLQQTWLHELVVHNA